MERGEGGRVGREVLMICFAAVHGETLGKVFIDSISIFDREILLWLVDMINRIDN